MQPVGAADIVGGCVAHIVALAIDLDGELQGRAVEVEDVGPDWMLTAEVGAAGETWTQTGPQHGFWRRHVPAKTSGAFVGEYGRSHGLYDSSIIRCWQV
jgi:hypothetical protein